MSNQDELFRALLSLHVVTYNDICVSEHHPEALQELKDLFIRLCVYLECGQVSAGLLQLTAQLQVLRGQLEVFFLEALISLRWRAGASS